MVVWRGKTTTRGRGYMAFLPMVVTKTATSWSLGKRGEGRQGIPCINLDVNTDMETRGPKASKEFMAAGSEDSSKLLRGG